MNDTDSDFIANIGNKMYLEFQKIKRDGPNRLL